jgi:metallo-beta-lactamase class B
VTSMAARTGPTVVALRRNGAGSTGVGAAMHRTWVLMAFVGSLGCPSDRIDPVAPASAPPRALAPPPETDPLNGARGPDIALRRLSERVWLHDSSFVMPSYGRVHANGLIVLGEGGTVIVDSAWTNEQTGWLLERAEEASGRRAVALIATHFHEDRAGGIGAARAAGVPVYASRETQRLLATDEVSHPFEGEAVVDLGDRQIEIFYPGAGHSPDNVVVYLAEEQLLFGGCLVRASEHDIGNLGDADVAAWPSTMDRLIERYGSATVVVPGHGSVGDASLLHHTRALALEASR